MVKSQLKSVLYEFPDEGYQTYEHASYLLQRHKAYTKNHKAFLFFEFLVISLVYFVVKFLKMNVSISSVLQPRFSLQGLAFQTVLRHAAGFTLLSGLN